jgi:hypothetical protein
VDMHAVPAPLRSAIGREATASLLNLLETSHSEAREEVIAACTERFERRLVDEVSKVRVDVAHLGASLRHEMATGRVELFKWSFLFWVGQVLAIAGLMAVMLRFFR